MPGIYAEKKTSDFAQVEPGTYLARCIGMIEIGTIPVDYGKGETMAKKVSITWELPTELHVFDEAKGEQPFIVSKKYTLSMHKKAILRKDLESWRGQVYTEEQAERVDVTRLIGQPCMLTIIHEAGKKDLSKIYANVASVTKLMKGQTCPPQINPSKLLCYEAFDWNVYDELSDYMKDQIKLSEEFRALQEPTKIADNGDNHMGADDENEPPF
jgi:hypothetical protein